LVTNSLFGQLEVDRKILHALEEMGFEEPTPIQAQAVPLIAQGHDLIGQAQTGTGKTAAFGIPMVEKVEASLNKIQAFILTPTRELAIQVAGEIARIAKFKRLRVLPVYGGQPIDRQIRSLRDGVHIVIGTPGRILDHLDRKTLRLDHVKLMVIDEADEMLDMGFIEDIEAILDQAPAEKQTMLFSATMPEPIRRLASKYLKDPQFVSVNKETITVPQIQQLYYEVNAANKIETLCRILDYENYDGVIIFCRTKRGVDDLAGALQSRGYGAEGLHGDLTQVQREKTMKGVRNGTTDILIATDVAARGIDIDRISHVINYDIPQDPESYVHRIGRTGRAGREGKAITLIVPQEYRHLRLIEKLIRSRISRTLPPTFKEMLDFQKRAIRENVESSLQEENLEPYREIARELTDYFDKDDAIAALVRYTFSLRGIELMKEEEEKKRQDFGNTGAKPGMVRLFLTIGRQQNIRPGDLAKLIGQEVDMPAHLVRSINIYDKFTFLEVPEEYAHRVINTMDRSHVNGWRVAVQTARVR
jgi:ATP-dependent RNA helicase DeaD